MQNAIATDRLLTTNMAVAQLTKARGTINMDALPWRQSRGVQAAGWDGDQAVILGGRRATPPDGRIRGTRAGRIPRIRAVCRPPKKQSQELVVRTAVPERAFTPPGHRLSLIFPFTGKASEIKSLELLDGDRQLELHKVGALPPTRDGLIHLALWRILGQV